MRPVGISRRSFWVWAATASASMSTIGKSAWNSRSSATTRTPRSSIGSRAEIASEAWASLSAPPAANRIVSPPAPAIAAADDQRHRAGRLGDHEPGLAVRDVDVDLAEPQAGGDRLGDAPPRGCRGARSRSPRVTPYGGRSTPTCLAIRSPSSWKIWRSSLGTPRGNSTSSASERVQQRRDRAAAAPGAGAARARRWRRAGRRARRRRARSAASRRRWRPRARTSRARSRGRPRRPADRRRPGRASRRRPGSGGRAPT